MAIYRFEAKIISRSQGRSATASAAYRAAERIEDRRTGQNFDYTRKGGVLHKEILAPAGTPDWMRDRTQLWNAVEAVEKRKDAQLARDLVLSLPHELTPIQRRELVREFAREEFVERGMIADLAIHAPDRHGDDRNFHAHIMLTMRDLTGAGFGRKNRSWNETDLLEQWRADWSAAVNRHLERAGHAARVDHRSLADRGVDREPEPKLGPVAAKMEREGRPSNAGDDRRAAEARNGERAEIAAELRTVGAEIVELQAERLKRDGNSDSFGSLDRRAGRGTMAEDERGRARHSPTTGTTAGGLVAQQQEAQERFERNSKALQARQADQHGHAGLPQGKSDERAASNENVRAKLQGESDSKGQSADLGRDASSREQLRRMKSDTGDRDVADESKGGETSPSQDDRLARFKAQLDKSFSRDDPGDRSR